MAQRFGGSMAIPYEKRPKSVKPELVTIYAEKQPEAPKPVAKVEDKKDAK